MKITIKYIFRAIEEPSEALCHSRRKFTGRITFWVGRTPALSHVLPRVFDPAAAKIWILQPGAKTSGIPQIIRGQQRAKKIMI